MRCGCPSCGAYMIQQEGGQYLGCRCPECDTRCNACMGTDSVLSREDIARFLRTGSGRLAGLERLPDEDAALDRPDELQEVSEEQWTDNGNSGWRNGCQR